MEIRETHRLNVEISWLGRCLSTQNLALKDQFLLGAHSTCDIQLPGYQKSQSTLGIKLIDLITSPEQSLSISYLNEKMVVRLRLIEKGHTPKGLPLIPLSFSEKWALASSIFMALSISIVLHYLRPEKIHDTKLQESPIARAKVLFRVPPKLNHSQISQNSTPSKSKPIGHKSQKSKTQSTGFLKYLEKGRSKVTGLKTPAMKLSNHSTLTADSRSFTPALKESSGERASVGHGAHNLPGPTTKGQPTGVSAMGTLRRGVFISPPEEVAISGSMDREAIRKVILSAKRAIRTCYERSLQRNSGLYGKLVLQWDIVSQGRVKNIVTKSSSLKSAAMNKCIQGVIGQLSFPDPPEEQIGRVTYPFVFTSK